jgi:hypothetical protein
MPSTRAATRRRIAAAPADRWGGLFRELLDLVGRDARALANPNLLFALLGVGFNTGRRNPWVAQQHDIGSRQHTVAFLARLKRSSSEAVFKEISERVKRDWAADSAGLKWWNDSLAR